MKTTLNTKETRAAVKFAAGIVSNRTTLPILSNLLCYSNGHFEVTGTDLDVSLIARCPSQTAIEGKITLPAKRLLEAVAGNGDFELSADEKNVVTIRAGAVARTVAGLAAEEFPLVPHWRRSIVPQVAPCPSADRAPDGAPVAVVAPEIAAAFGMAALPNVIVMEEAPSDAIIFDAAQFIAALKTV